MQHTLLICHECKEMLYSHLDLSKTNTQTSELQNEQIEMNLSLLAEEGFHSHVHVCEQCHRQIEEKTKENIDFEKYHSIKWKELLDEIEIEMNEIESDIENLELIEEGYENTKENEHQISIVKEMKYQSYKQLLTLLTEINTFESQLKDFIYQKWFSLFNKCFSELKDLSDDILGLLGTITALKSQLKDLEQKHVFSSLFPVKRMSDQYYTINDIPFLYSIDRTSEFNSAMGTFVLSIYLMGKQVFPSHSIEILPLGNMSQISVKMKDMNQLNQKKTVKSKYNLYIITKSYYVENDESFRKGFTYLMTFFNDIIEKISEFIPQLKQKQSIEIQINTMQILQQAAPFPCSYNSVVLLKNSCLRNI